MTVCPACRHANPNEARYCMQCGARLEPAPQGKGELQEELRPRLDVFALSLIGSLVLTLVLTVVFGLPVFILGAFLPFFWLRRKRG